MNNSITNQLGLFDFVEPNYDELINKTANDLLDMLNEDLKVKFEPQYTTQLGNNIILIVANKNKETLFNVIDVYGKTPAGFCVNWRSANHVKQELIENLKN
jgi:hypothetical protein